MACYLRMIVRIGPELLLLGMGSGVLSILDIESCIITHSHIFLEFMEISDCIVLDASHFLLAADEGVFKVTKSEVIKQSFKEKVVNCICHVTDSVYLLTLPLKTNLIVWNEDSDQQLLQIDIGVSVYSIRRILSTKNFIIDAYHGIWALTITDLKSKKFSYQMILEDSDNAFSSYDKLQLQITDSHFNMAVALNHCYGDDDYDDDEYYGYLTTYQGRIKVVFANI